MRTGLPTLLILAACSGGAGGEDGKGQRDGSRGDKGDRPEPVTVVEVDLVRRGSVADALSASAVVESEASADLIPEASGVVTSVHADEGDTVRQGDLLAVLKNVSLGTGAARTTAEVQRLERQLTESRELAARGALSERDLREIEYQLETARLSAREASSGFRSTRLTAPFAGVVAMRDVHVGELATSGKPAFTIVDLDQLRVVANLPERDLRRVDVGQAARLVSAYDVDIWTDGVVERIAPVIDASSGTFRVTVGLDPDQDVLRPGQFVSVSLEVDRHEDVWVVPKQAVVYEDGAPVVYSVIPEPPPEPDEEGEGDDDASDGQDGWSWWPFGSSDAVADDDEAEDDGDDEADDGEKLIARRTVVTLGLVDTEWAEIEVGLEGDETVITVGHSHLRDGARVRPVDETTADAEAEIEPEAASNEGEAGDKG